MKTTLSLFLLLIVSTAFADLKYYSPDLNAKLSGHTLKNETLKAALFDTISANQTVLGYDGARKIMFGKLFLKNDSNGNYISDVYCQKRFGASAGVGVNTIPNGMKINCEHTWPQSKFTRAFDNEMQKSDLHHLYPSDSRANSIRGNDDFIDVKDDTGTLAQDDCSISKYGSSSASSNDGFEPPLTHKGNVARALFYFSVRYKISIPKTEEDVLRRWNDLDPVDQEEIDHNDAIQQVQGNRNPFIDFPSLANDINKF
ncbi:MAG: endonuclease [Bacteriovorax sp.]|nr:endonuclease [Bacteriovorax sp.]